MHVLLSCHCAIHSTPARNAGSIAACAGQPVRPSSPRTALSYSSAACSALVSRWGDTVGVSCSGIDPSAPIGSRRRLLILPHPLHRPTGIGGGGRLFLRHRSD